MLSNFILLACLFAGFIFGLFPAVNLTSGVKKLLTATVLIMLFLIGASLGMTPDLGRRAAAYGLNAAVIAVLSIVFSALCVYLLVKILGHRERRK